MIAPFLHFPQNTTENELQIFDFIDSRRKKGGGKKHTVDNTIIITIERHLAEHVVVVGDSVSLLLQVREDQKR